MINNTIIIAKNQSFVQKPPAMRFSAVRAGCYNEYTMTDKKQLSLMHIPYKPLVLVILDGFGVNPALTEGTWQYAKMPTIREIERSYPFTTLQASGISVGLMFGEPGNSEVGHLTIGSGRVVYHHLPRIIVSIQDGSFFKNEAFLNALSHARKHSGTVHMLGLFSSGSVHAYADHWYALLDLVREKGGDVPTALHMFTDGRDAPQKEGAHFIEMIQKRLRDEYPFAAIVSLIGRRFAMDRDDHWERIESAYRLFTEGGGNAFDDPHTYIEKQYAEDKTDEFIEPGYLKDDANAPAGRIRAGDAVIFVNYREDSMRELTEAFTLNGFDRFARNIIDNVFFVTMTEYDKRFPVHAAFPPLEIAYPLARVISDAGKKQIHIAESEKYAHVTYFFNGGIESPFPGEDRKLIPSPKNIRFDEKPEMSAAGVTESVLDAIESYDFVLANFANGDMVGHTGNLQATVKAIEVIDFSLGMIIPKVLEKGGAVIVTADHGNAEEKIFSTSGEKRTNHTSNPVPFYLIANETKRTAPRSDAETRVMYGHTEGVITDIAPTILELLDLPVPKEMIGLSLLGRLLK
ncbi:MAG: 2,3-bisphosphoglycerate-independent phosphoglycerate mutase [Candidatus Niyogibacteria bacterium CG10_big_fil_rev_8_21_14_0_10_46_36]|uniref:2,3-bisphosphoglycerate-independent phosphoglycerate mutase n=1 Tax=Candidatus Niyogibacteria bacterium CG10_big_fil_rev_8_21_14_0_10_46_36 TaxID=1974726 RepID=A0A2H0TCJ0_9BACT|nr:MAG: 2,3-bisphosphoglycerate-independent phosphoglycerate mutase [Candidatus Niyogibacteria bacterium CG10_big_fil_rev_8_21_14_0_10_46_36]